MNKQKLASLLAIVFLSMILSVTQIPQVNAQGNTIANLNSWDATAYPSQWKSFNAHDLHWLWYSQNQSVLVFRTSSDGISFSETTTIGSCIRGYYFSLWYSESLDKVCYVRSTVPGLYYRRGTPYANGTITWDAAESSLSGGADDYTAAITLNSTNYPWVTTWRDSYQKVIVYQANDLAGTSWALTNASSAGQGSITKPQWLLPLSNGKMFLIATKCGGDVPDTAWGYYWNGTWNYNGELPSSNIQYGSFPAWAATVDADDNIHFICINSTSPYALFYSKWTSNTKTWGTLETLYPNTSAFYEALAISCERATGYLHVFFQTGETKLGRLRFYDGGWLSIDYPFGVGTADRRVFNTFVFAYSSRIGLAWVEGSESPYTLKFDHITTIETTVTSPTNTTYTTSTVPVEISAIGGTIDTIWFSLKRGTEIIFLNTTYTEPITMTLGNGSYTFDAYANNTDGTEGVATVMFTVSIYILDPSVTGDIFYFRSNSHTVNNVTGYVLSETQTASSLNLSEVNDLATVSWGFRVFILENGNYSTELTSGTPTALLTRTSNGQGIQNASWTPSVTSLHVGFDALLIRVYVKIGSDDWVFKAVFVSSLLMEKQLNSTAWVFSCYTTRNSTIALATGIFSFGDGTFNSLVQGLAFQEPSMLDMMFYNMQNGNIIGAMLFPYTYLIGGVFYLIALFFVCVPIYKRYESINPVLFIMLVFGGSGGVISLLLPVQALSVGWIIMVLAVAAILFRLVKSTGV